MSSFGRWLGAQLHTTLYDTQRSYDNPKAFSPGHRDENTHKNQEVVM